jgi:Protein of unknown function (DUF2934)
MVTVLVEKREFAKKLESGRRPRRSAQPPAPNQAPTPAVEAPEPELSGDTSRSAESSGDESGASDRYRQISVFAYLKAEMRGFAPGHMWDDWLAAEREVDALNRTGSSKNS